MSSTSHIIDESSTILSFNNDIDLRNINIIDMKQMSDPSINSTFKFDDSQHHCSRPDPRIQIELENLNTSTDLINKLEVELDDARTHFRQLLSDSSQKITNLAKKLGSCVERARPYYEARIKSKELQLETQKAALRFERATSCHTAAKEMVRLAEEGLQIEGKIFDSAWQEMLNHSTIRVNESERERVLGQKEHEKTSKAYIKSEQLVTQLHQQLKRSINKASLEARRNLLQLNNIANQHQLQLLPYFEMKAQFNQMLDEQISKIRAYEARVAKAKVNYAKALHRLEEISDEIHEKRKIHDLALLESRGVGVGAESPIPSPKLTKALRKLSLESSQTFPLSQMIPLQWFYKSGSKSATNSERDECESIADSVDTNDTLDDTVIDNLMLEKNIEMQFCDILDVDKSSIF